MEESFRSAFGGAFLPKKSQNMTECVPVPSSEHVAEIVGRRRQGKIKFYTLHTIFVLNSDIHKSH